MPGPSLRTGKHPWCQYYLTEGQKNMPALRLKTEIGNYIGFSSYTQCALPNYLYIVYPCSICLF